MAKKRFALLGDTKNLKKSIQVISNSLESLEGRLNVLQTIVADIESAKPTKLKRTIDKQVASLESQAEKIRNELLEEIKRTAKAEMDNFKKLQKEFIVHKKKSGDLKSTEAHLKKEYTEAKHDVKFIEKEFRKVENNLAGDFGRLQREVDSLFKSNSDVEKFVRESISEFKKETSKLKTDIVDLNKKLSSNFERFGALSNDVRELTSLKANVHDYLHDVDEMKRSFNNVVGIKDQMNSIFIELTKTAEQLTQEFKELKMGVSEYKNDGDKNTKIIDKVISKIDSKMVDVLKAKDKFEVEKVRFGQDFSEINKRMSEEIKELTSLKVNVHDYLQDVGEMKRSFNNVLDAKDKMNSIFIELTKTSEQLSEKFGELKAGVGEYKKDGDRNTKVIDKLISKIDSKMVDVLKAKDKFEVEKVRFGQNFSELNKRMDEEIGKLHKYEETVTQLQGGFKDVVKSRDTIVKSHDNAKKNIAEGMKMVDKFGARVDGLEKGMKNADKTIQKHDLGIDAITSVLPEKDTIERFMAETQGKVEEMEHFYRNPGAWIEEKLNKWLQKKIGVLQEEIESLSQIVYKHRIGTKTEMLQTLAVSAVSQISTTRNDGVINSNISSLEFIFKEMKRHNVWNPDLFQQIIHSLQGTRDYWELRQTNISDAIQLGIERLEQIK